MISLVEILLLSHDPISASGNHGKIIESPLVNMIWILSSDFKLMIVLGYSGRARMWPDSVRILIAWWNTTDE